MTKSETLQLRIDSALMENINTVAELQHMSVTVLVRSWIEERVTRELHTANNKRKEWLQTRLLALQQTLSNDFAPGPALVLHAWPLSPGATLDVGKLRQTQGSLLPINRMLPLEGRINRRGYEVTCKHHEKLVGMGQAYKTAELEGVWLLPTNEKQILGLMLDDAIVKMVCSYIGVLAGQQMPLPYLFTVSMIAAKGFWIVTQPLPAPLSNIPHVDIREDAFTLPTFMLESFEQSKLEDVARLLRPLLDEIWQASGLERSLTFSSDGKWQGPFA